jgi:hypothetical protein
LATGVLVLYTVKKSSVVQGCKLMKHTRVLAYVIYVIVAIIIIVSMVLAFMPDVR